MTEKVHIVWDNSNIFLSGKGYCSEIEMQEYGFRIYFENIIDLAADNRPVEQVFCVGSVPPPTDTVWGHIERKTGKRPELYERGAQSGKEQAVDQALQTRMLRLGFDVSPPETLILMSGDGKGDDEGVGFFADIKRLHKVGWKIELLAWERNCSRAMKQWAQDNGIFVNLEEFYSSITFIEKKRRAKPIDFAKHPRRGRA